MYLDMEETPTSQLYACVYKYLEDVFTADYAADIPEDVIEDIVEDIATASDYAYTGDVNMSDLRLAVGRVFSNLCYINGKM